MKLTLLLIVSVLNVIPAAQAFLRPLQQRDSILVADQVEYGFRLDSVQAGTVLALPDFGAVSSDTLTLVRGWKIDTVKVYGRHSRRRAPKMTAIEGSVVLAPFEEGSYHLPDIPVGRLSGELMDTLVFGAVTMDVKTIQIDTASFSIHDIKPQLTYPVTLAETVPYAAIMIVVAALVALAVVLVRRSRRKAEEEAHRDPPHIVALREIDKFRSDKYWAPERQKAFYSGITDALRNYIDARFGVDAPEMTTAELFKALKREKDITPELYSDAKVLFETADFVKFAKFTAADEENAKVLPTAVRFVTSTYQAEIEDAGGEEAAAKN